MSGTLSRFLQRFLPRDLDMIFSSSFFLLIDFLFIESMDRLHNLEVNVPKEVPKLTYTSNIPTLKNISKAGISHIIIGLLTE